MAGLPNSEIKYCYLSSEDIDNGLEASGSKHKYQTIMILSFVFLKVVTDSFYAPLPYFLMDPKIKCKNETSTMKVKNHFDTYECTLSQVCRSNNDIFNIKKKNIIKYELTPTSKHTFINDFNLWCDYIKIGLLVGSASIGSIFTNIICPLLTENIGRNNTIRLTLFADILIKSLLFYVHDIYYIYAVLLCINITNNIIYNTTALYINEMVSKDKRGVYYCFFNSLFGISGIMFTLIFNFTSSWKYLHGFSILNGIFAFSISVIFLEESIRFLFIKKQNEELIGVLQNIANINSRRNEFNTWHKEILDRNHDSFIRSREDYINNEFKNDQENVITKIFKSGEDTYNFVAFTIISLVIISGIVFNAIDIKSSNDSLTYPIAFYAVDFFSIICMGYVIDLPYFGRKKPAILLSLVSSILYLFKYIIEFNLGADESNFLLDLILRVSVSLSFNILMEYNFEIYSTDIRSTAFNINKLLSHFGDFFTPLLMSYNRPLATVTLSFLYFVMTLFIFNIRETNGLRLRETVNDDWEEEIKKENVTQNKITPNYIEDDTNAKTSTKPDDEKQPFF